MLSLQILFVYFLALPSLLHPSILFHCFYTCPTDESRTSYLVIGPDQPVVCCEIFIPYYPRVDVVRVKSGHLNSPDLMIVKHVHHAYIFEGHKLQPVRGSCRYSVLSRTTRIKVLNVLFCTISVKCWLCIH